MRSILVVEDDRSASKVLRVALTHAGFSVLEARDERAALQLVGRQLPDLVLQDLILPDSADFRFVRALRTLPGGAEVPVIALSGMRTRLEEARDACLGYAGFLFKPVRLPDLLDAVRDQLARVPIIEQVGGGRRILVVDDDPGQRKLIGLWIEQWGFATRSVATATAALEAVRQLPPDALVSDVLMPHVDGFALCQAVRRDLRLSAMPVVLVSAATLDAEDYALARRVGASAVIAGTPNFWGLRNALLESLFDPLRCS